MIDSRVIVGVMVILSVAGVLKSVDTYSSNRREMERENAQFVDALADIRDFTARTVTCCDKAQTVLMETHKLYADYLTEIQSARADLLHADQRRRELIAERNVRDMKFAELLSQAEQMRSEVIQRLSRVESKLNNSQKLKEDDKQRLKAEVLRYHQGVDVLDSKLNQVKKSQVENRQIVQDMINSEESFLEAQRQAQEAEVQIQLLKNKTEEDMRYVEESSKIINSILIDTEQSLENVSTR